MRGGVRHRAIVEAARSYHRSTMAAICVKRVYEEATEADGRRVLVDRLWPRGVSRSRAAIDVWLREIAPSDELRAWYRHQPDLRQEFEERYLTELGSGPAADALSRLRAWVAESDVTVLTATRAIELSHARLLAQLASEPAAGP